MTASLLMALVLAALIFGAGWVGYRMGYDQAELDAAVERIRKRLQDRRTK